MSTKTTAFGLALLFCVNAVAADAPASEYLGDNQRTGYAETQIPVSPVQLWAYHEKHPPRPAWREPNREVQYVDFDYATQTAIAHGMVFFGSSSDHKVYALDGASGEERWTFCTEGPVRFAPVAHGDRVYVASDDGHLYCLDARTGRLMWKLRGGPTDEKLIGNDQMISHWPARTGVLVEGDKLFFTAGMWSRDGVFVYCLNPEDGTVLWKNDTSGFHFMTMPHASGYGGVSPQGYLVHYRGMLYVPTGRGAPACFDAKTGEFLWFENGHGYKPHQPGGSWVMAYKDWVIFKRREQHTEESVRYEERDPGNSITCGLFALHYRTGDMAWSLTDKNLAVAKGNEMVMAGAGPVIQVDFDEMMAAYPTYYKNGKTLAFDKHITDPVDAPYINMGILKWAKRMSGKIIPKPAWMSPLPFRRWSSDIGRVYFMLQAGGTVLAGGRGKVTALDAGSGKVLWQKTVDGNARGICAADGRLVVSTTTGKLYCFGEGPADSGKELKHATKEPAVGPETRALAGSILEATGIKSGYCLMLGAGDGALLHALVDQSDLVVYCLEPDGEKVAKVRAMLDDAGLLGVRAAVHHGEPSKLPYVPYVANLIVWGDKLGSGVEKLKAEELYRVLRPYGGVACQLANKDKKPGTRTWLVSGGVPEAEISESVLGLIAKRGGLPGAGEWTHAHADVGRTGSSGDKLARLPLGMLWWGGPGPARIVSRHWRAPVPLFSNGILFVQGQHDIIAVDAYNGREMWNRHLENVGRFPPASRGGNIVADGEAVYCVLGLKCLRLDAQTGETLQQYEFPLKEEHAREMAKLSASAAPKAEGRRVVWEYLGISGGYIIGTLGNEDLEQLERYPFSRTVRASRYIFAVDKTTGKLLWEHLVDRAVWPTAIVADGQRVYYLDRTDEAIYQKSRRRGNTEGLACSVKALNIATGRLVWAKDGLPLERMALMLKGNALVALPHPALRDKEEAESGVSVYSARDGALRWERASLPGVSQFSRSFAVRHSFIIGDTLFLPWAFDLHTGKERLLRTDPLTGKSSRYKLSGKNFCGTVAAGEDIVMFRSACTGFAEITRDSGSYWLPEVRPSCWISIIPAGGIVLAPEGYSTCICPYNYKTSVALRPVERNEEWSVYLAGDREDIQRMRQAAKLRRQKARKAKKPVPEEPAERVRHLRANLNAPGDRMDGENRMWLAYPRPKSPTGHYLVKKVPVTHTGDGQGIRYSSDYVSITGTSVPWIYVSALSGPLTFTARLSNGEAHEYTVRLHFAETEDVPVGGRVFDVKIQGKTVVAGLDIVKEAGALRKALIKECDGIAAAGKMTIELVPVKGEPPLLCGLEILEAP